MPSVQSSNAGEPNLVLDIIAALGLGLVVFGAGVLIAEATVYTYLQIF